MKIGRLSNDGHVPLTTLQEVKEFYVSTKTDDASVNVFKDIMVDIVKGKPIWDFETLAGS